MLKVLVLSEFNLLVFLSEIAFTLFIACSMSNVCIFVEPSRVPICMVCGGAGRIFGWNSGKDGGNRGS